MLPTQLLAKEVEQPAENTYATWSGLGPDKWATTWLIDRYITPNQRVKLVPYNKMPAGLKMFDVPNTQYFRTIDHSTFSQFREGNGIDRLVVDQLGKIVHDIEINLWLPDAQSVSKSVEESFRELQNRFGRDRVPYGCYMAFFDTVTALLGEKSIPRALDIDIRLLADRCAHAPLHHLQKLGQLVPELPVADVIDLMRARSDVVFIDVREPEEFSETHIPGALNTPIRNIDELDIERLQNADLVVSYCVKDFRAFEMARKLQGKGIGHAVILNPYGLRGWIQSGLPVTKSEEVSEEDALAQLAVCLDRGESCSASF